MSEREKQHPAGEPGKEAKESKGAEEKKAEQAAGEEKEQELSEEDRALKEKLDGAVEAFLSAHSASERSEQLGLMSSEIKNATTTMTSVPKPLKFLRPHYGKLAEAFERVHDPAVRADFADMLAVLSMVCVAEEENQCLKWKMQGHVDRIGEWGHEFARRLSGDVGREYTRRTTAAPPEDVSDLMRAVSVLLPFDIHHNLEAEAVDLLIEVQQLPKLLEYDELDADNARRMCLYLLRCADFLADPEDLQTALEVAFRLYLKRGFHTDALRTALRLGSNERVAQVFAETSDPVTRQQMALIVGRQRAFACLVPGEAEDSETLNELAGNCKLSEWFRHLAQELDVMAPKSPEDVYKSHLAETGRLRLGREDDTVVESAKQNAASSFVNGFVNAAFGTDKLVTPMDESGQNEWVFKNKEMGQLAAAASLGLLHLWDADAGFAALDRFLYSSNAYIKAGGVLGLGVCNAGVYQPELDAALGMLSDYVEPAEGTAADKALVQDAACVGLGLAYAGTEREEVMELLAPIVSDPESKFQVACSAALSLGLLYVGTSNGDAALTIVERLMVSSAEDLATPGARFLALALGLVFLGRQEAAEATAEVLATLEHEPTKRFARLVLDACAYAGTGNVLKIQAMLHECAEHIKEEKEAGHQMAAVLGLGILAMGDDLSREMTMRATDHLLQYGELPVRRAVPIALATLYASRPDYTVIDALSKLSHDTDAGVAGAAILGMGLVGAGTNNSKIAGLLRQLSSFYSKEANHLYLVRLAQGLLHMGKGLLSLSPRHSDGVLVNKVGLGALLVVSMCGLDLQNTLSGDFAHYLYFLAPAINPRMLLTVDEELNPVAVSVRVGQAVEVVGLAGNPRAITGFQTHDSPVLMNEGDRAEFATEDYEASATVLEGVVVVRKKETEEGAGESKVGAGASAGAGAGTGGMDIE
mmetsp:Transcript_29698/g.97120  ORF Transcript_29698/g.97120 Transcript_29698/m.97120 type:complete len:931 (-) Transcript_29698:31-2823(-)|eukprot:CAMPEP_0196770936 /NCGR_PEP_ID=MMETSP1104-20130614/1414_1 /TAXON_ID=33652 /ORGANISM="Cafeteria sp., Strain Caron Lab Isolate" /LENGTH=930 /DNA_ID=CAMNT_0042141051 /DNA_START=9 /DNA_END=2801 /DNA_ORIENTATION=-